MSIKNRHSEWELVTIVVSILLASHRKSSSMVWNLGKNFISVVLQIQLHLDLPAFLLFVLQGRVFRGLGHSEIPPLPVIGEWRVRDSCPDKFETLAAFSLFQ